MGALRTELLALCKHKERRNFVSSTCERGKVALFKLKEILESGR